VPTGEALARGGGGCCRRERAERPRVCPRHHRDCHSVNPACLSTDCVQQCVWDGERRLAHASL